MLIKLNNCLLNDFFPFPYFVSEAWKVWPVQFIIQNFEFFTDINLKVLKLRPGGSIQGLTFGILDSPRVAVCQENLYATQR